MIREAHENTRRTYNKIAQKYHELFKDELDDKPLDREYLDRFRSSFKPYAAIVDAGCGPSAHMGRYLSDRGMNVLGIDISEKCIELASRFNPGMRFLCADLLDWSPEKSTIDGIISFYSTIYTPKTEVDALYRVFFYALAPGGKLLVTVKRGDFEGYQDRVLGFRVHSYFAEYNETELEDIITRNGFTIDEIRTRGAYQGEIENPRIYCLCSKPHQF